jgi:hypothetical protein
MSIEWMPPLQTSQSHSKTRRGSDQERGRNSVLPFIRVENFFLKAFPSNLSSVLLDSIAGAYIHLPLCIFSEIMGLWAKYMNKSRVMLAEKMEGLLRHSLSLPT